MANARPAFSKAGSGPKENQWAEGKPFIIPLLSRIVLIGINCQLWMLFINDPHIIDHELKFFLIFS